MHVQYEILLVRTSTHVFSVLIYVLTHVLVHQEFPTPDVLSGMYLQKEFRPDLIELLLSHLTPERVRYALHFTHYLKYSVNCADSL